LRVKIHSPPQPAAIPTAPVVRAKVRNQTDAFSTDSRPKGLFVKAEYRINSGLQKSVGGAFAVWERPLLFLTLGGPDCISSESADVSANSKNRLTAVDAN
jgi:hypothetical protein